MGCLVLWASGLVVLEKFAIYIPEVFVLRSFLWRPSWSKPMKATEWDLKFSLWRMSLGRITHIRNLLMGCYVGGIVWALLMINPNTSHSRPSLNWRSSQIDCRLTINQCWIETPYCPYVYVFTIWFWGLKTICFSILTRLCLAISFPLSPWLVVAPNVPQKVLLIQFIGDASLRTILQLQNSQLRNFPHTYDMIYGGHFVRPDRASSGIEELQVLLG